MLLLKLSLVLVTVSAEIYRNSKTYLYEMEESCNSYAVDTSIHFRNLANGRYVQQKEPLVALSLGKDRYSWQLHHFTVGSKYNISIVYLKKYPQRC